MVPFRIMNGELWTAEKLLALKNLQHFETTNRITINSNERLMCPDFFLKVVQSVGIFFIFAVIIDSHSGRIVIIFSR